MKRVDLIKVEHSTKIGQECPYIEPNILEDCIFYEDGIAVGFYIKQMPERMCKLADLANAEFNSKNVPKIDMARTNFKEIKDDKGNMIGFTDRQISEDTKVVKQMCAIIGSTAPKPYLGRNYPNKHSNHSVKSCQPFIKAMLLLAKESEALIRKYYLSSGKSKMIYLNT